MHTEFSKRTENEKAATCSAEGSYEEVTYCTKCEKELHRAQKTTEKTAHTESEWVIDSEPSCKLEGERHMNCPVCNEQFKCEKIEKLTTHTTGIASYENIVGASCKEEGSYDEVFFCTVCDAELSRAKKSIDKLTTHTEATDKAVAPTCTSTGLTEGKHCTVCDEVTAAQEVLPFAEHDYKNKICTVCSRHDYPINFMKVNGVNMDGYVIATDTQSEDCMRAASKLQCAIYERAGYLFEIVDASTDPDNAILIRCNMQSDPKKSFRVWALGSKVTVNCFYPHMLDFAITHFIDEKIANATGIFNFSGTVYTEDVSVIYYEDFGAVGDGKTNDFKAIYDIHNLANTYGQTVKARPDSVFYISDTRISGSKKSIIINTNTDWQGAKFIIDDSEIAAFKGGQNYDLYSNPIFYVKPNTEHASFTVTDTEQLSAIAAAGLNQKTTHIDFKVDGWDGAMMIVPYNSTHKVARRKGYSAHSGEAMHELIVIDKYGSVDPDTPIMFDYTSVTKIVVYKLDADSAITIKNATIETIDSRVNHKRDGVWSSSYINRGITVERSYTTVENINHIVSGGFTLLERANGYEGASSNGMFRAQNASYITFKDCIIPGRQAYNNSSSYNFRTTCANKVVLDNCIQSNFWVTPDTETGLMTPSEEYTIGAYPSVSSVNIKNDSGTAVSVRMHWGIGGGNYCKNLEFINSKISRYDAHNPLYNGKIINSSLNGMELTGYGTLEITNVDWYQYGTTVPLLYLRSDYGYHWDGDIVVTDTRAHLYDIGGSKPTSLKLCHYNYVNWYFGYTCAFPNVTVDNLDIYYTKAGTPLQSCTVNLLGSYNKKMHLSGTMGTSAIFDYIDANKDDKIDEPRGDFDGDGIIDPPCDLDGDGVVGETSLIYSDYASYTQKEKYSGIKHPSCKVNLNPVKPPSYFKVINNDGVGGKGYYTYVIPNSSYTENGVSYEGFFGNTKFIYQNASGAEKYFVGTNHTKQTETKTFKFE